MISVAGALGGQYTIRQSITTAIPAQCGGLEISFRVHLMLVLRHDERSAGCTTATGNPFVRQPKPEALQQCYNNTMESLGGSPNQ